MYLRGSNWSMRRRRRKPINWFSISVLVLLIALVVYINVAIVPDIPTPFVPSPTATRDPESYRSEAEALFADGKLLQAIAVYEQVIPLTPDDPGIYVSLARVQLFAGHPEDALVNAENALLLSPNNSMAHALRGGALAQQQDFLGAQAQLQLAIQVDPNNGIAHALYAELLGNMYINNTGPFDALDLAIAESQVAVQLAPSAIESHRARGFVLEITGNYEEAIREYQAAVNINPNIPDLHLALGRTYRVVGALPEAVEEYTIANTLNPADPLPDLYTSRVYFTTGEYAKAAQYAEQAVRDDPTDPYLRGNWGLIYYYLPDWPRAVEQFSLAINGGTLDEGLIIEPLTLTGDDLRVTQYFYTYAVVLARLNRCSEALPVAQLILSAATNDADAVYNAQFTISVCEQSLRDPTAAPTTEPESP
ncbi:MAG: tetratricopeptide repeat protein [Anaerolineales bacterium]|nr:tetratricopeptide repeat protein [Anaerolineales bacterium]